MKTGTIQSKILQDKDIYDELTIAVFNPEKGYVEVAKISHMFKDQWVTDKETLVLYGWELHQLYVYPDDQTKPILLKTNDWNKSIINNSVNTSKSISYILQPLKFLNGTTNMECQSCHSHFIGSPRQGICNNCCILLGVAKLRNDSEIKTKSHIFTQDIKPNINFKELAELAFNAGKHSNLDFDTWYNQQIL